MEVLQQMYQYGHEKIVFAQDEETGLRAIVAIHNTNLGPAVGGTRFYNYASEEAALYDVLRLSRGMTLKNAAAGLALGGGKAVIIGAPEKLKSQAFFHAYGRVVHALGGNYYTAEDMNISAGDVALMNEVTPYVTGTPAISGNPSPFTAHGVYRGMKAGARVKFGTDDLNGLTVAVQGLGSVGYALCELVHQEGARLKVFDVNGGVVQKAVAELGAQVVEAEEILTTPCDVFAPCAMGAVLNSTNVEALACKLIAGAANNVLVDEAAAAALAALDILYLPDYIINAGGVINCGAEITEAKYDVNKVMLKVDAIYDTTLDIIALSQEKGITTYAAADEYALDIVEGQCKGKAAKVRAGVLN